MPRFDRPVPRGVTIIELLMVMVIFGIIATLAIPRINMTGYKSDAAARQIRGALQVAQRNGITRQGNVIVSMDSVNKRVQVIEDNNDNEVPDVGERVINYPLDEGAQFAGPTMGRYAGGSTPASMIGTEIKTINSLPSFIMRRDGSASTDVEIYLTVRTAVPSEFRAIVVDRAIGKPSLWRYSGTAWVRISQ